MALSLMIAIATATAVIEVLCFCGIIYGWPLLQFILQKEKYFFYLCNSNTSNITSDDQECEQQESSFSLVFTLAVTTLFSMSFPSGYLLDRYGTRIFRLFTGFAFSLGCVLLAVSSPATSGLLFPAMIFIGFSGLGLLVSNFQLSNLFPSFKGVIVTLINGMFDSSVVVCFLFKKSHDNGSSIYLIFQVLAWATLFIWFRTFVLMPKKAISPICDSNTVLFGWEEWSCFNKTEESNSSATNQQVENCNDLDVMKPDETDKKEVTVGIRKTFKKCLQDKLFWTNIFQFSVISLRVNFFLGSLNLWLKSFIPNEDEISGLMDAVGIITMMGAIVSTFNGLLIDLVIFIRKRKIASKTVLNLSGSFFSMLTTCTIAILLSVLIIIRVVYPSFILLLLARSFLFGGCAAFVAINFPQEHFGKLFGLTNLSAGLFNLLQYGIVQICLSFDPTMFYINIFFLILTILTLIHPLMIFITMRKIEMTTIS